MLAYGVFQVAFDLRSNTRKRVIDRLKGSARRRADDKDMGVSDFRRQTVEATGLLARAFGKLSFTSKLQRVLEQANLPCPPRRHSCDCPPSPPRFLAGSLIFGVPVLAALGIAAGMFVVPILYLFRRRKKRLNKLIDQLPDVFELLSQALRAGHSLASGMQLVQGDARSGRHRVRPRVLSRTWV